MHLIPFDLGSVTTGRNDKKIDDRKIQRFIPSPLIPLPFPFVSFRTVVLRKFLRFTE
jgi:hypothetical protein